MITFQNLINGHLIPVADHPKDSTGVTFYDHADNLSRGSPSDNFLRHIQLMRPTTWGLIVIAIFLTALFIKCKNNKKISIVLFSLLALLATCSVIFMFCFAPLFVSEAGLGSFAGVLGFIIAPVCLSFYLLKEKQYVWSSRVSLAIFILAILSSIYLGVI